MKSPKLVIPINEIPEPGLIISGELDEAWITPSLLPPYRPLKPLKLTVDLQRINGNVRVEGRLETALSFSCSRTMALGVMPIAVSFSELFYPAGHDHMNLDDGVEAELFGDEPYVFTEGLVTLEPFLREELVLAQSPYPTVPSAGAAEDSEVWTSNPDKVDPRWEKLKQLKLN